MHIHPFFQYKVRLAELWEHRWCSMAGHETAPPDVHRKVLRMVSPLSEHDAKLMLREMGQKVRWFFTSITIENLLIIMSTLYNYNFGCFVLTTLRSKRKHQSLRSLMHRGFTKQMCWFAYGLTGAFDWWCSFILDVSYFCMNNPLDN